MLSLKQIVESTKTFPRIRLMRWTPGTYKKGMNYFTVVERCHSSPSGFRFTGTSEFVEGKFDDIEYSLLPLSDNDYIPISDVAMSKSLGPGIHFRRAEHNTGPMGQLKHSVACWDHLINHDCVEIVGGKLQASVCDVCDVRMRWIRMRH